MIERIKTYFSKNIWKIHTSQLPIHQKLWIRFLRITFLSVQGLTKTQLQHGASALTYYSLLSIVPVMMLFFGIARGFLLEDQLRTALLSKFTVQEQILNILINLAENSLEAIHQGVIASVSVLLLIWSSIKILKNIEIVMNSIWGIKRTRSVARQFSDYLALLFICPIIIIASSGVTLFVSARLNAIRHHIDFIHEVNDILFIILNLLPYLLTGALFTFLYIFIPNTSVKFSSALYAGLVTGFIYQILQWAYIYFQIGVSSANSIYGSFAAIPLFIIWLNISWVIFLLGSQLTFALQNSKSYEFIPENFHLSHRFKELLALRVTFLVVDQFCKGKKALIKAEISKQLTIPLALISEILFELCEAHVLTEVKTDDDEESAYHPYMDINQLTIKKVLDMINLKGDKIPLPHTQEVALILSRLESFSHIIDNSTYNTLIKNLK